MKPLHWMIQFAFDCHDRSHNRVFTIKTGRTRAALTELPRCELSCSDATAYTCHS
jgi:hypothetical protein